MKTQIKKLEKLKIILIAEIEAKELKDKKEAFYKEESKQIKVSGFRPGAAPIEVLEKQHGSYLKEKFVEKILPDYYSEALSTEKITPASMPRIHDVSFEKDNLKFSAELEIKPSIDINEKDYKGIKINEKNSQVEPQEVEKVITQIKDNIKKFTQKDVGDEELAKWAGYSAISLLQDAIKTELLTQKLHERTRKLNSVLSQHLLKIIKFEVPKAEAERHHKELIEREIYNLRSRGINETDIEKYKKDIDEKLKTFAEDEVRLFYILEQVALKENLKIENNLGEVVLGFLLSHAQYVH